MDTVSPSFSLAQFQRPSRWITRERPKIEAFGLRDPPLDALARIVRGADTDRLDLAPQSAGLLALSLGLSHLHGDDSVMLAAALPLYDALYAWCQGAQAESHSWNPAAMAGAPR